jgi:serine O-acetyltransferase
MVLSLPPDDLSRYVVRQLDHFFPDGIAVEDLVRTHMSTALDRLEYCFRHVNLTSHCRDGQARFNHLSADHWATFLWFLSSTAGRAEGRCILTDKLFCLNKAMNGLQCMHDTGLPDIFLLVHTTGTVLGKAEYGQCFVAFHGCTVGAHNDCYPRIGSFVAMGAHSTVFGDCTIGDRANVGTGTAVFRTDVPGGSTICTSREGAQTIRPNAASYAAKLLFAPTS